MAHRWMKPHGFVCHGPVKTDSCAETPEVIKNPSAQEHAPAGKRREESPGHSQRMNENDPEKHGSITPCGPPPGLLPGRMLGEICRIECAQVNWNRNRDAQSMLV